MEEVRVKIRNIYCYWLVLWFILYKIGFISVSPWISLLTGIVFTFFFLLSIENIDYRYIIICLFWHIVLLLLVTKDTSSKAIFYNIFIFTLYMLFLHFTGKSFQNVYFKKITSYYNNREFSLSKYIKNIIQNM
tara:strand:- start:1109 stop:1507 length:399 start_codon:yes stop_codon:yes gene_type:complete